MRRLFVLLVLAACNDGPTLIGTDAAQGRPCSAAEPCPAGELCETAGCGGVGLCVAKPASCTQEIAPVCGCDRITYGNDCARRQAGIARDVGGPCAP